ncbi:MAG: hypothetical protein IK088_08340 [Lachnospiraceae bacterium]|nr:hypothetical protein [Lachnospiraceae bacterium]
MRRRNAKSHTVEIVLILVIFAIVALANALRNPSFRTRVTTEVEYAIMQLRPQEARADVLEAYPAD